jgi:hypothetical protein
MKIKFGAIVTDGRGKLGGHVASKNRNGAYLRTKVTPSNPQTVAQSTARGILGSLSQSWGGLTDAERLAWNSAVDAWSKTDIFGDIKNPSGLNLYVKLNANLLAIAGSVITLPPAKVETPTAVLLSVDYITATGVMTFHMSDDSAIGSIALLRATPALSQGVSFVKSELRVIGYAPPALTTVTDTGSYEAKFGDVSTGANIFASVQFVMPNGQKTVEQKVKVQVNPAP